MSSWQKVKIGDFLFERKGRYKPDDEQIANLPRIEKIDFSGNIHIGNKNSKTDMILVKDGDLIISGINVAKGAMGIYTGEDAIATIHYSSYTFDKEKINVEYFKRFLKSPEFIELLNEQVKGGIKTEIKPKHILPLEIQLPDLNIQAQIVQHFENIEDDIYNLTDEIENQQSLLKQLKQTILQEAIEGKLTANWREQNQNIGSAKELLEEIKKEKTKLIKEKKIKAQKPLPAISDDEIPFDIPSSWEWCRLGEIVRLKSGNSYSYSIVSVGIPYIRVGDMNHDDNHETITSSSTYFDSSSIKKSDLIPVNSIIFPKRGGAIATNKKKKVEKKEILVDSNTMAIIVNKNINFNYIYTWFSSLDLSKLGNESVIPQINNKDIEPIILPFPPLEEQKEIVSTIEKLFAICDELENEIKQNKTTVDNLMATVLKEALEE